MTLNEALNVIKYTAKEIDIKVCYTNDLEEECTLCKTFVEEKAYKENKNYWASKIVKFNGVMRVDDMERYANFKVDMLDAEGKDHFFIFASNFH